MNYACILKLVWQFINGVVDLWCRVLHGLYNDDKLNKYKIRKNYGSCLWKDFLKAMSLLLQFSKWSIRDGKTVDMWDDNWIKVGSSLREQMQAILEEWQGRKVRDFVIVTGEWNWQVLQNWLSRENLDKISHITLPYEDQDMDKFKLVGVSK
ncbi:unnamed protein product [Lathyrus sativus]|nr:unnamed protein product [Lathyrus sativus]